MRSYDGLPLPARYWAILTISLGLVMAVLDGAIANIALPTIARELHVDPASSIWVVNAYQLAVTIALLPLASLGEIVGYRRIYQLGLGVFTLFSLACALSHSLTMLTLARILQGFGAAGIMSVNTALVRSIRAPPSARASASTPWWPRFPPQSARPSPPAFFRSPAGNGCSPSTCRSASWRS